MDHNPVNYFKKQAKRLRHLLRNNDVQALARYRQHWQANAQSLMRAQHVVAREAGFANWEALLAAPDDELQLAAVMHRLPSLCSNGIATSDHWRLPPEEANHRLEADRTELRRSIEDIRKTREWLRKNVVKIKTITTDVTSYGLKHLAEEDIGYITNGVFIAAAIIEGYGYRMLRDSLNVEFAMSKRSIRAICERQNVL